MYWNNIRVSRRTSRMLRGSEYLSMLSVSAEKNEGKGIADEKNANFCLKAALQASLHYCTLIAFNILYEWSKCHTYTILRCGVQKRKHQPLLTFLTWTQLHRLHNPLAINISFWPFTRLQSNNNYKESNKWDFREHCTETAKHANPRDLSFSDSSY